MHVDHSVLCIEGDRGLAVGESLGLSSPAFTGEPRVRAARRIQVLEMLGKLGTPTKWRGGVFVYLYECRREFVLLSCYRTLL